MFTLLFSGFPALFQVSSDQQQRRAWVLFAMVHVLLALVFLLILAFDAAAQEVASTSVDLGPVVQILIELLAPAIATAIGLIGVWILTRLGRFLGLSVDAQHRATVEQGLERAVGFAVERVGDRVRGGIPVDMKHTAIAHAAEYASRHIPDALAHFGVGRNDLVEMVEARLQGLVVEPGMPDQVVSPLLRPTKL